MTMRFCIKKGFFSVPVINSYFPKINKMNAPLMPGRIMAQMATNPHRKINHRVSGVLMGIRLTIREPEIIPATKQIPALPNQPVTCLPTIRTEATMRPKKRLQVGTG